MWFEFRFALLLLYFSFYRNIYIICCKKLCKELQNNVQSKQDDLYRLLYVGKQKKKARKKNGRREER